MVRQLRRVRSVYAAGVLLSVLGLVLQQDRSAGGRQVGVAGLFLAVFTVLLAWTVVQLWRHHKAGHCSTARKMSPTI
ncbi:hypothetical protein [Streptomyces sp. RKAG290]|uniref:hypothetical protein n=1 Tax=Streptomyces sp. RKAG290 TaxID=2888348 RepID=UPI0027E26E61|nr:hypothetical protein [Streptomyces sp. RKAG290]